MFLIAKIVRGRRLLHELEQQEKEKERERERQQQQSEGGIGCNALTLPQTGEFNNSNVGGDGQLAGTSNNASINAAMRRRRFSSLINQSENNTFANSFCTPHSTGGSLQQKFNTSIQCDSMPSTSAGAIISSGIKVIFVI